MKNLTVKAQISLSLLYSILPLSFLQKEAIKNPKEMKREEINNWFVQLFEIILEWLDGGIVDGDFIYDTYFFEQIPCYTGFYVEQKQPLETISFNICYCSILYACKCIYLSNGYTHYNIPSDVKEASIRHIDEYLQSARQASYNPEAVKEWEDKIIARLLKDHYTEDPNDFGKSISREYIEELLWEKLPF